MTKIFITIEGDLRTKSGRNIRAKVITDDELINVELKAPFIWSKTYRDGEQTKEIRKDMKVDIKDLIKGTRKRIEDGGIVGRTFEVEV